MATIRSNYESLAGGTVPTTSNTNYNNINIGTGNTLVTDSSIVRGGATSSLHYTVGSANPDQCYWTTAGAGFGAGLTRWFRWYLYWAARPSVTVSIGGFQSAAFGNLFSVRYGISSQRFVMFNAAGASVATGTVLPATGQWIRIEGSLTPGTGTGDGAATIGIYQTNPDGTTADDTLTTSTANFGTVAPPIHFTGMNTGATSGEYYISHVAFSDTGPIGPDVTITNLAQTVNDPIGLTDTAGRALTAPSVWTFNHSVSITG